MLNFGTTNLEQILNMGQSVCNQNGFGYTGITSDVETTSKTVFVKTTATTENHHVSSNIIKPTLSKVKRFVLVFY